MEDSKAVTISATPVRDDEPHDETITKDKSQYQDEVKDGNKSKAESQQDGIVEDEKTEPATQDLAVTKSQGAESGGKNYSSFGPWQKRMIVFTATMGAFFSPFTAQIYFPALTSIAKDLHVSNSKINLTMTTYMVRSSLPFSYMTADLIA
jgi:hypothetical protein